MTVVAEVEKSIARGRAPFLVWPVARREFYISIGVALLPAVMWGVMIFGWRVLVMLIAALAAATVAHGALKRWTQRGKVLVYAHSVMSVLVLVALAHPLWPAWTVAIAGALTPVIVWLLGGPGRERLHVVVVWMLLIQLMVIPLMPELGVNGTDMAAVVARDRLVMGDIRNQRDAALYRWLGSWELGGDDAMRMRRPQAAALETLDELSDGLRSGRVVVEGTKLVTATQPGGEKREINLVDDALANNLPSVEMLLLGAVSGRVGTVSLIGMVVGGLYLAYRHILRPRSVGVFLTSYGVMLILLAIGPMTLAQIGLQNWWHVWSAIPGELGTLLGYVMLNGDVAFATVFILALPGTEPLSQRGRRVFLIIAGVAAAAIDRMNIGLPAATVALCGLMPLAGLFDQLFAKRSWLNRIR